MIGFDLSLPQVATRQRARRAARMMVAANRFAFGTDFATGDGVVSGSRFANASAQWLGGLGNASGQIGRYHFRRWRFDTTWAPKAGRFLFTTDALIATYGVVRSTSGMTIQKIEIRLASDESLVDTVRFAGAGSRTLAAGDAVWSDPIADLGTNTGYFLDIYWTVALGGIWPSGSHQYFAGEYSRSHATTDFSASSMPPANSGNSAAAGGADFGPAMFVAQGWDGSPVALIIGTSAENEVGVITGLLARGDIGHIAQALGNSAGGRWNYQETARTGATLPDLHAPSAAPSGSSGTGLFLWLATALAQLLIARAPWQFMIATFGRSEMLAAGSTLATVQAAYADAVAVARSTWPGIPWIQEAIGPYTTASANQEFVAEADQTPYNTAFTLAANGGFFDTLNSWILGGGGGLFAAGVDITPALLGASGQVWKAVDWSGTLTTAVTANTTSTVTLTPDAGKGAPPLGHYLVFEPGSSNVDRSGYGVATVTPSGGNHTVTFINAGARTNVARNVQKAHSAGTAVRAIPTIDGLHATHRSGADVAAIIVAAKASLATIAGAYAP